MWVHGMAVVVVVVVGEGGTYDGYASRRHTNISLDSLRKVVC